MTADTLALVSSLSGLLTGTAAAILTGTADRPRTTTPAPASWERTTYPALDPDTQAWVRQQYAAVDLPPLLLPTRPSPFTTEPH